MASLDREIGGEEAAKILGVSTPTVVRMADRGELPVAQRIGPRGDRRYNLSDVLCLRATNRGLDPDKLDRQELLRQHSEERPRDDA